MARFATRLAGRQTRVPPGWPASASWGARELNEVYTLNWPAFGIK